MGDVASELLALALAEPAEPRPTRKLRWASGPLGTPRVDLEDKEAVQAVLDERA